MAKSDSNSILKCRLVSWDYDYILLCHIFYQNDTIKCRRCSGQGDKALSLSFFFSIVYYESLI